MSEEDQERISPALPGKNQRNVSDKPNSNSPTSDPAPTKVGASTVPVVETTLSEPTQIKGIPVSVSQPAQAPSSLPTSTSPSISHQSSSQCPSCAVSSNPSKSDNRLMIISMIALYVAAFFAWFGKGQAEDMGARLNLITLGFLIAASVMALVKSKQKKWALIFAAAGLVLWCIGTVAGAGGDLGALADVFRVF